MKKSSRFLLLSLIVITAVQAVMAAEPANYYKNAEGKRDEALMTALRNIIRNHNELSYNALWNAFESTDTDDQGYIIDMYSNCRYRPNQHGGSASQVGEGFNREHSFPKSWFNDGTPMYTDLFHLYPTDIRVNNQRSNYPFGQCANGTRLTNGSLYGKGKLGSSTYPGYSGTVFEPDDEYKGDFARTYFYMVTCYKNELSSWTGSPQLNKANGYKAFSTWSINMLMEWTRLDPVSEKEIKRNDAVQSKQGNRNPFIDHPELAEYIWGNKQGESWGGEDPSPRITAPQDGMAFEMGTCTVDAQLEYMIYLEGKNLTEDLTLTISDSVNFRVNTKTFAASEVNEGTMLIVTFNPSSEGTFHNEMTLSSSEASTSFKVFATAKDPDDPEPPVVLGASIVEDWEGCTTGGYWNEEIEGDAFNWIFSDAGIWKDNLSIDEQSCRLGKTSSSAITMAEDVDMGTSAIAFWAGCFGNDADANLRVDYSTNQGSSWNELGDFTFTRGRMQYVIMEIPMEGNVRFRIVQTSGSRVNIDDITIYGRVEEPIVNYADVNRDGEVNIADINAVIGAILGAEVSEGIYPDVNQDTEVNIADINAVIAAILGL